MGCNLTILVFNEERATKSYTGHKILCHGVHHTEDREIKLLTSRKTHVLGLRKFESLDAEGSLEFDGQSTLICLRWRHSDGETPRSDMDHISVNNRDVISTVSLEYSRTRLQRDFDRRRSEVARIIDLSRCIQEKYGPLDTKGLSEFDGWSSLRCSWCRNMRRL